MLPDEKVRPLATAINAFVTAAVSAPAAGGLPPVAHAARGEVFSELGTALLYAQVIATGATRFCARTSSTARGPT